MIDVLVAGGGPVGLVTAIHAATAGLDVVVVEPRPGPVDKACGEGLMPGALAHLDRIGVDPPGIAYRGIRYVAGARVAEARFSGEPGRGVRRTALHGVLGARAAEVGVRVVAGSVGDVVQRHDRVEAAGLTARYLVGADGLHSTVRRQVGLDRGGSGIPRYGVRQHFAVSPWSDLVEVHWLPDVEVYVTPVADDVVGVAVLGRAPLRLDDALARLPALAARLGPTRASTPRGAGPLRQRTSARHAGRVVLVGDAAGYVDALTGEGLRVGFAEAEAAIACIVADDLPSYESAWRVTTRSYRWLTEALVRTTAVPAVRPWVVPAAARVPAAFRRIVDTLAD